MRNDDIVEIGIDKLERLCIRPKSERFTMIYRSAAEVHWDNAGLFLYSPKPREWTYLDWYMHITSLIKTDCDCQLKLTDETIWTNIDEFLKQEIENVK